MKIIHTGDWHLGKILNGKQFLEDQSFILEQFIQCLKDEKPDVVVIAGIFMIQLIQVKKLFIFLKMLFILLI